MGAAGLRRAALARGGESSGKGHQPEQRDRPDRHRANHSRHRYRPNPETATSIVARVTLGRTNCHLAYRRVDSRVDVQDESLPAREEKVRDGATHRACPGVDVGGTFTGSAPSAPPAGPHHRLCGRIDYSDRRVRTAVAEIPDGCYRNSDVLEIGPGVTIRAAVTVTGDEVSIDCEGTDAQIPVNCNAVFAAGQWVATSCAGLTGPRRSCPARAPGGCAAATG
ncbi:MAG: hydantoinase B/oxoprolinase family protein, partial [Gammaproteobacteria bacterium]